MSGGDTVVDALIAGDETISNSFWGDQYPSTFGVKSNDPGRVSHFGWEPRVRSPGPARLGAA